MYTFLLVVGGGWVFQVLLGPWVVDSINTISSCVNIILDTENGRMTFWQLPPLNRISLLWPVEFSAKIFTDFGSCIYSFVKIPLLIYKKMVFYLKCTCFDTGKYTFFL